MEIYIYCTIIVSLLTSFLIILMTKIGIVEWLQVNGTEVISELANCTFCMSFWIGLILSIIFAFVLGDMRLMLVPFCATPLARFLI